jgi:hypothetical protein
MAQIRISAKSLGELALPGFCPRCFWIKMHCPDRLPFQIFPGIFSSIDSYTKKVTNVHFGKYRKLPPWLKELGELGEPIKVPHYSKFFALDEQNHIKLWGSPDEMVRGRDGSVFIIDYKTAKFTKAQDILLPLYEVQLNAYAYIAKRQGYDNISGLALVYMEPTTDLSQEELDSYLRGEGFLMGFRGYVRRIELTAEDNIPPLLKEVRRIYDLPAPPLGQESCSDCRLLGSLINTATYKLKQENEKENK